MDSKNAPAPLHAVGMPISATKSARSRPSSIECLASLKPARSRIGAYATTDIRNRAHCRQLVFSMVSHWPCKRIFVLPALGWLHPVRQWIERSHGWDLPAAPYALVFPMAVRNLNSHVVVL